MSRIGIQPITIPEGVHVQIEQSRVLVKGPKGENSVVVPRHITILHKDNIISVGRSSEALEVRAFHGLIRSLIANAVKGVTDGFSKNLEIQGVGYRAKLNGEDLELSIGFSHIVKIVKPIGISFQVKGNKITIMGHNKQQVGEIAAQIRRVRPPDAYKGKGIRYEGEIVKLKPGKAAKTGAAA